VICSFAASGDSVIPNLPPINVTLERKVIQGCLSVLFARSDVAHYQPWDSHIHPPEIAELVFLDVKACSGDIRAAALLKEKSELAQKYSHFVTLRFLQGSGAAFTILPSTPQVFDADDVAYVDVEIRGMPTIAINVFEIACVSSRGLGVVHVIV
jgi:hypothetical protein